MKVFYELMEIGFSPNETLIYSYFIGFKEKPCKTINRTIGKKLNISLRTVNRVITKLKQNKLIIETYENGRRLIQIDKEGYKNYRMNWLIEDGKKKARQERAEREKNAPSEN